MLALLAATLTASFFDSLNPSAIAQQMVLQAMVREKGHIRFFILGIGLANVALGAAIYYGVAAHLSRLWALALTQYPTPLSWAELAVGAVCLAWGARALIRAARPVDLAVGAPRRPEKDRLSRTSLFLMGALFCGVELTSALPYFGFLALLAGYRLSAPWVLLFILLYTLVYAAPLILLYWGYNRLRGTALIERLERALGRVSAYVLPAAVLLLGVLVTIDGGSRLVG